MAGKQFGQVVIEEAIAPVESKHKEQRMAPVENQSPAADVRTSAAATPEAKPRAAEVATSTAAAASSSKRFRIELTESNSKKRTFPVRNDIGRTLDLYCLDYNVDRQTLVNLMIKEFIEKHPDGVKFKTF